MGNTPVGIRFNPGDFPHRTADGKFNDPFDDGAGGEGTFLGRNMAPLIRKIRMEMLNVIGSRGEKKLAKIGFARGHQASGALELWNYPVWLRDVVPQNVDAIDHLDHVDLASLEST